MPRIVLDRSRCSGLGICESFAEDVFQIQLDGRLELVRAEIADADLDAVRQACASCPTEALRIEP